MKPWGTAQSRAYLFSSRLFSVWRGSSPTGLVPRITPPSFAPHVKVSPDKQRSPSHHHADTGREFLVMLGQNKEAYWLAHRLNPTPSHCNRQWLFLLRRHKVTLTYVLFELQMYQLVNFLYDCASKQTESVLYLLESVNKTYCKVSHRDGVVLFSGTETNNKAFEWNSTGSVATNLICKAYLSRNKLKTSVKQVNVCPQTRNP